MKLQGAILFFHIVREKPNRILRSASSRYFKFMWNCISSTSEVEGALHEEVVKLILRLVLLRLV